MKSFIVRANVEKSTINRKRKTHISDEFSSLLCLNVPDQSIACQFHNCFLEIKFVTDNFYSIIQKVLISVENMCTREELKTLLYELLLRVDQVAFLSAKCQLDDEFVLGNAAGLQLTDKMPQNARFKYILRFQKAYIRYFVFACDPSANFIVPLQSTSLTLFMTNILSDIQTEIPPGYHTTNTIVRFLEVSSTIVNV